ncbi:MAG: GNAT family N-acetyltransferase [Deltaproteobacteria bacterium]|nr:GNAT family N-acetyltransferase [Deltaproteobacteria bacterium]
MVSELCAEPFTIDESEVLPFLEKAISGDDYVVLLTKDQDNRVVGLITLDKAGAVYAGGKFGVIHEFFVDSVIRSNGVGKQLLDTRRCSRPLTVLSNFGMSTPHKFWWLLKA